LTYLEIALEPNTCTVEERVAQLERDVANLRIMLTAKRDGHPWQVGDTFFNGEDVTRANAHTGDHFLGRCFLGDNAVYKVVRNDTERSLVAGEAFDCGVVDPKIPRKVPPGDLFYVKVV
jgi:hypothetical protein